MSKARPDMNGKELSVHLGRNPQWVYQRNAQGKELPAHYARKKREVYAFPEACVAEWEVRDPPKWSEVYLRPDRLVPWLGSVGWYRGVRSPESIEEEIDHRRLVDRALETLTPKQRQVLIHRYGLYGEEVKTQKEVGALMGFSGGNVNRVENAAMYLLRARLYRLLDELYTPARCRRPWDSSGPLLFYDVDREIWDAGGFTHEEALDWMFRDIGATEAVAWRSRGFTLKEAVRYRDDGVGPRVARWRRDEAEGKKGGEGSCAESG